jgi:hypothetical protein
MVVVEGIESKGEAMVSSRNKVGSVQLLTMPLIQPMIPYIILDQKGSGKNVLC